jgi:LPS-assembly protein
MRPDDEFYKPAAPMTPSTQSAAALAYLSAAAVSAFTALMWPQTSAAQTNQVQRGASSSQTTDLAPLRGSDVCTAAGFARARLSAQRAAQSRRGHDRSAPMVLEAATLGGEPGREVTAEGEVLLQQDSIVLRTDRLRFDQMSGQLKANGRVQIERDGDRFDGSELQVKLDGFHGYVLDPEYHFALTGAGGRAKRIDFFDRDRVALEQADYTSCARSETERPAWVLRSDRVRLDFAANEGVAEGAVLEFLGVPILGAPVLKFPLTDERKSGWLPPSINLDNKKGLELAVPYYWNIAPNLDATLAPTFYTRRGLALGSQFRYLGQSFEGQTQLDWLPRDRVAEGSRHAFQWKHRERNWHELRLGVAFERVSDDDYWKDFPRHVETVTPRLLTQDFSAERDLPLGPVAGTAYARVQHWQALQGTDPLAQFVSPYQRSPQLGWRANPTWPALGVQFNIETEINRFTRPRNDGDGVLPEGLRAHALAGLSRRWGTPGWWIEPGVKLNAATYRTDTPMADGRRSASRTIPSAHVDAGMVFERDSTWFGRDFRQTLEPRMRYGYTPFRDQSQLPNFDAAAADFSVVSIYGDNPFSGIDRVSDAHQIAAGASSRWIDADTGIERLRAGAVQRYLLRDQRITPDGVPITQRFSDVLLYGQSNVNPRWTLGGAVQYSPETDRVARSVLSARYSPGPFRTLGVGYRFVRDASEQVDIGWQWPIFGAGALIDAGAAGVSTHPIANLGRGAGDCRGTLYSVGRVNYSSRDRRVTDSLIGFEYDAGCWVGRIVADRLSTGSSQATTRWLFQLELVGLSRLGSNPLRVLKDNIPGYQLLRDDSPPIAPIPTYE